MKNTLLVVFTFFFYSTSFSQFDNFTKEGKPLIRFSTSGNAIDAHDGEIACFNGVYYLYGTSYDCGFEWGNKGAPFCGFKVYSSKDLKNWEDRGYLFDATSKEWQCRCDGKTYGCFRPHVIYNKRTGLYVLWINVYDNRVGYRVFTANNPIGPFKETAEPHLAVNSDMPVAGLNNGDHDTFVDDDGTAYIAYTDWRSKGAIVIEKLGADYLTGTGECVKSVTEGATEAPCLFRRGSIYYLLYSDPNCGYCSGTGTSYKTAASPLGPWSRARKISDNSCGGQPSFVSVLRFNADTMYLYGSDLWNNGAKNEALADYFWTPLSFNSTGDIIPISCANKIIGKAPPATIWDAETKNFALQCDISKQVWRSQSFVAGHSGKLNKLSVTVFKNHYPDAELIAGLYRTDANNHPVGKPLYIQTIDSGKVGWSPKSVTVYPGLQITKGERLSLVLHSASAAGSYGAIYNNLEIAEHMESISRNNGKTYTTEPGRKLMFHVYIETD